MSTSFRETKFLISMPSSTKSWFEEKVFNLRNKMFLTSYCYNKNFIKDLFPKYRIFVYTNILLYNSYQYNRTIIQ